LGAPGLSTCPAVYIVVGYLGKGLTLRLNVMSHPSCEYMCHMCSRVASEFESLQNILSISGSHPNMSNYVFS